MPALHRRPALHRSLLKPRWLSAIGFALFAYGFHRIGSISGFYPRFWWFQIVAHFLSAAALALLLARAAVEFDLQGYAFLLVVIGGSAVGAVGWELIEYFRIIPTLIWWGIEDSLFDLFVDAIGFGTVLWAFHDRARDGASERYDPVVGSPQLPPPRRADD